MPMDRFTTMLIQNHLISQKLGTLIILTFYPMINIMRCYIKLFPPRMRVANFVTPSLYVQVPARASGQFRGIEIAQVQMANAWEMGRATVMAPT